MARKVRFGLANTKYAVYNSNSDTYGALQDLPGAVSLSFSKEGGDNSDFYADNDIYHTFPGTNGGYSGDLELAAIPDSVRVDLLGEFVDPATGVQFEKTNGVQPEFALVTEMLTDKGTMAYVFYNCVASRPDLSANTKGESPDVDTETLNIRVAARDFTIGGVKQSIVQGHIEKTASNAAKYAAFFSSVAIPGESGESGISA